MARTSKYALSQSPSLTKWNAGLYIRLSREDGDKVESESISSQKAIIEYFLSARTDINIIDYYIDDGWSGTNFERPAFKRMLSDITEKRINCVIVKDLSRFGRNYIESGKYLETVFPLLKVRFIAINDSVDNIDNPASVNSILLPFKNIINDEYCRDISTKVRSSLTARRSKGKFIGAFASYGYKKAPHDHNKLIVDGEAAEIVRSIFDMFLSGTSILGIARRLNSDGVKNPSSYKAGCGLNCKAVSSLWTDRTVRRILSNAVYAGDMVQKKYEVVSYKVRVGRKTQENEWIVVLNTHEAIIPREKFNKVQSLLKRDTRISLQDGKLSLFAGFIKCADCGRAMNKKCVVQYGKRYDYYVCSTYRRSSRNACTKHTIRADLLETAVQISLNKYIRLAVDFDALKKSTEKNNTADGRELRIKSLIQAKTGEIGQLNTRLIDLYPDYKDGIISRDSYLSLKERYESKLTECRSALNELQNQLDGIEEAAPPDNFVNVLKKYGGFSRLTREIITALVDNIYVREGGSVDVILKCKDKLQSMQNFLSQHQIKTNTGSV